MKFKLDNGNQEIELKVKGYEASIPTKSYWDNNWLVFSCKSAKDNGTEPNFVLNIYQNHLLTIDFFDEKGCEITFQKYAATEDVEGLIRFCKDSLRNYPVRDLGKK